MPMASSDPSSQRSAGTSGGVRRILITAGPTHEPIDAVRYLANRSSGRMGCALAKAAEQRGHRVTLLLGPGGSEPPHSSQSRVERFRSTADLQNLLRRHWPQHDVLIMAAAVADYRPIAGPDADPAGKVKRTGERLTLDLEPTPDLLADLAEITRPGQIAIGFALEPADRLESSAREKLIRKRLDAIVANPLETMDAETITATVYLAGGAVLRPEPNLSKSAFAAWLIEALPRVNPGTRPGPANDSRG